MPHTLIFTNQVTCGTSDDIYFGMDASEVDNKGQVMRYAYSSGSGKSTIGIDPRNQFIHPFSDLLRQLVEVTEEIYHNNNRLRPGKTLGINGASV